MPINKIHSKNLQHNNGEELEVEKLKKLINGHVVKIQSLQVELQDLERELNHFFDSYYGAPSEDMHTSKLDAILSKIAKLCSKDEIKEQPCHQMLLKVEGYLNEGSEQKNPPQEQLSNLALEYYNLVKQISEEKLKKPAHEIKQAILWVNVKTSETISKIKEEINSRIHRSH